MSRAMTEANEWLKAVKKKRKAAWGHVASNCRLKGPNKIALPPLPELSTERVGDCNVTLVHSENLDSDALTWIQRERKEATRKSG